MGGDVKGGIYFKQTSGYGCLGGWDAMIYYYNSFWARFHLMSTFIKTREAKNLTLDAIASLD